MVKYHNEINAIIYFAGMLPYEVNLLDFSTEEHSLRIMVVDSRGMTDSYLLTFNGVAVETLPSANHLSFSLSLSLSLTLTHSHIDSPLSLSC